MATIKAKNSAGAWVDVAAGEAYEKKASSFKLAWVPRSADGMSYDLSSYLLEDDDFLLAFTYGSGANPDSSYLWLGSEGKARIIDGEKVYLSLTNHGSPLNMIADIEAETDTETARFNYDKASRTFTYAPPGSNSSGSKLGAYAALIYAG
jgi:hypothetical protein